MRKLIAILLLCLVPGLSFAQTPAIQAAAPSVTITPPRIEATGITLKHVAIVLGAVVLGAVVGEAIIGDALGTMIGMAAGYLIGSQVAEEFEDEML